MSPVCHRPLSVSFAAKSWSWNDRNLKLLTATDRYIAKLIFVPLVGTLVIAVMLFVLDKMLRLFDFVVNEGGPVSVVWRMLANMMPEYLTLGIPIALMLGILLAFRKLATSSELDVFQAVGQGYGRLLKVPYIYAIILAGVNLALVGYIQPYARYAYEEIRFELRQGALGASIKTGEFTSFGDNLTLRIEESREDGRELNGIFIRAQNKKEESLAATARSGQFMGTDDPDTIILRLRDGVLLHNSPAFQKPRVLSFTNYDVPIPLPKIEAFRQRGAADADKERTLPELIRVSRDDSVSKATQLESRAQFHYRVVEILSMFLIPLLAVSLAVPPKRSTSALGVFLSIVLLVTQHKINEYGLSLGSQGRVPPVLALWVPFLAFSGLCWWMFRTLAFVPGGQPIGALERIFSQIGKSVRSWLSVHRRWMPPSVQPIEQGGH